MVYSNNTKAGSTEESLVESSKEEEIEKLNKLNKSPWTVWNLKISIGNYYI